MTATITEAPAPTLAAGKLDWALKLASLGLRIFPCKPNSKLPMFEGYQADATTDPETIRRQIINGRNYGVLAAGDLVVVDLDRKHGKDGFKAFRDACAKAGVDLAKVNTLTVQTPSGGGHLYLRSAEEIRYGADVLGPGSGVDIRSQGKGYVVGPGSTIGENAYQVLEDSPIADMGALAAIFPKGSPEPKRNDRAPLPGVDPDRAEARAREFLATAAGAVEGSRGSTAYRVAARLRDFGCDELAAYELMAELWAERCEPPMPLEDLAASVNHAYRYAQEAQGIAAPEANFSPMPDPGPGATEHPFEKLNKEYAFILANGKKTHPARNH